MGIRQSVPEGISHFQAVAEGYAPAGVVAVELEGCGAHVFRAGADGDVGVADLHGDGSLD